MTVINYRDRLLLNALYLTPLTIDQLLELSGTWPEPFNSWKTLYRRLCLLKTSQYVRSWKYAFATSGPPPSYYRLSLAGFRMLTGNDRSHAPTRYPFTRISPALHTHTFELSRFIVRLLVAAHRHGVLVTDCWPENTLALRGDGPTLFPDFVFSLRTASGHRFNFCVELDTGSEPIVSRTSRDSIVWKMRRYEEYHYSSSGRFRVLFTTTRGQERVRHMAAAASDSGLEPRRSIFLATTLDDWLGAASPLTERLFLDHRRRHTALLPDYLPQARIPVAIPRQLLARAYALA